MLPELDLKLTLEQKFRMQIFEQELAGKTPDELKDLLLKLSYLLMTKDNAIKLLTKRDMNQ